MPFLKAGKSALILGKKSVNCVQSSIQNVVLRASREKSPKMFACGAFFSMFLTKSLSKCPNSQNLPCPENFLVALLVRTVYLDIFWPIQGHSAIFRHVQAY